MIKLKTNQNLTKIVKNKKSKSKLKSKSKEYRLKWQYL